jgi:hypothetical protein
MNEGSPSLDSDVLARVRRALAEAGWHVRANAGDAPGGAAAVPEMRLGDVVLDFGLLVDGRIVGLVEVKPRGLPREVVAQQAHRLAGAAASAGLGGRLFAYFTTGTETVLVEPQRPETARDIARFHSPATLARWAAEPSLADQVAAMPAETDVPLRPYQREVLARLEDSLATGERRALVAVQSGGRLTIAAAETYRLLRHTSVRRVLVLVDRQELAQQAAKAFGQLPIGEGRRFADAFPGRLVVNNRDIFADANVLVMTVQRLHSLLNSKADSEGVRTVLPNDAFDLIWADESHRLVAGRWGEMLAYFDAPVVGMTSTPSPEALRFFDGNLVANIDLNELLRQGVSQEGTHRGTVEDVFQRADALRGVAQPEEALLRALDESDAQLSWREMAAVVERAAPRGVWAPATFVLDFIASYLRDREAEWAVDPAASTPALLAAVVEAKGASKAVGFVRSAPARSLARALTGDDRLTWTREDALTADAARPVSIGLPDLIVSFPPFGVRADQSSAAVVTAADGSTIEVRDELGYQLLLKSAAELNEDGEAIFLVGDGFFGRRERGRARAALAALGLHVQAVVAVRQGFAAFHAPLSLVFVRREPADTIFVGELSAQTDYQQLASNLRSRRRGPVAALGRLVSWDGFRGYGETARGERVEALLAETGIEPTRLGDILAEPLKGTPRQGEDFEPKSNAVYLPTFANATAHSSREDLTSKPSGYLQLVLDPEWALADYVATLLNTELGRALRESISSGGVRATIRRSEVAQLRLPLPELEVQQTVVTARSRIRSLRLELDSLERRLALHPDDGDNVIDALRELGQSDPVLTFREALPFPLASILWRYEAVADTKDKVEHLHRFFEASAAYFATVLLSAFRADAELFTENVTRWNRKLRRGSFNRGSFGTWTTFGRQMTKSARLMLDGAEVERGRMLAAFSGCSERFADAVAGHALWDLLDEAKDERNKSKGHGGLAGPTLIQNMHTRLSSLLSKLAELLARPILDVMLVRPGAGRFRRGINRYERAELLQGSINIFREEPLEVLSQLEADGLYLVSVYTRPAESALHLEPFFRMKPSPESAENACYFYSELHEGEVEFISHHFEGQPSITEPDPEVVELISTLSLEASER